MSAAFFNTAILNNNHLIAIDYGRQSMSNDKNSSTNHEFVERLFHKMFAFCVERLCIQQTNK